MPTHHLSHLIYGLRLFKILTFLSYSEKVRSEEIVDPFQLHVYKVSEGVFGRRNVYLFLSSFLTACEPSPIHSPARLFS